MAAVDESKRKWRYALLLLVIELCIPLYAVVSARNTNILYVERVFRRQSNDFYYFTNSSNGMRCGPDGSIYLISDKRCVTDQELLTRGCTHAWIQSQNQTAIAVFPSAKPNVTYLKVVDETNAQISAIFEFNSTNQLLSATFCTISKLEVYRGKEWAIEIDHQGFSLGDNGTIKISTDQLGYDLMEYIGELYRMSLSCSDGLPESGCLFFKVRGQSNVTNAKFNCTVPGTLHNFTKCSMTPATTVTMPINNSSDSDLTTTTLNIIATSTYVTLNANPSHQVFYVLGGLGGGILVFTFCIIMVCICFFLQLARRKRLMLKFTAENVYTMEVLDNGGERVQDNDLPASSRPTVTVLSDSVIVSDDTEQVYAVLEQTQPSNVNAQSNKATEQNPNPQDITDKAGLKSQSATWTSGQHSKIRTRSPRHENLELVQIYDNVTVEMEGRAIHVENECSYQGKFRKHSLPANLSEHQHSTANVTQECPISNKPKNGPNEMTDEPIYSQPDMNKKREERRKKKEQMEQLESMVALHNVSPSSSSPPPGPQVTELEREQKNDSPPIKTDDSGAAIDRQQQTDNDHLQFGKELQVCEQNNNPNNKMLMDKDECLYDAPTSLDLIPKKSKHITEGKKEEDEDGEEEL